MCSALANPSSKGSQAKLLGAYSYTTAQLSNTMGPVSRPRLGTETRLVDRVLPKKNSRFVPHRIQEQGIPSFSSNSYLWEPLAFVCASWAGKQVKADLQARKGWRISRTPITKSTHAVCHDKKTSLVFSTQAKSATASGVSRSCQSSNTYQEMQGATKAILLAGPTSSAEWMWRISGDRHHPGTSTGGRSRETQSECFCCSKVALSVIWLAPDITKQLQLKKPPLTQCKASDQ